MTLIYRIPCATTDLSPIFFREVAILESGIREMITALHAATVDGDDRLSARERYR